MGHRCFLCFRAHLCPREPTGNPSQLTAPTGATAPTIATGNPSYIARVRKLLACHWFIPRSQFLPILSSRCLHSLFPSPNFNSLQTAYRFSAGSLPRSDALPLFQLLPISLQLLCQLSTSFRRASLISTTTYRYRCIASSLPRSDARLSFQPLAL